MWHHGCQNFGSSRLSETLQDLVLSLSWIWHCFLKNFPERPPDITTGIPIIVYLILQHFSWFKNDKLYLFSNWFLALLSLVPKQWILLLTRTYCLWRRWWPRVTHPPNFVTSSQDVSIDFIKSAIDLKKS